MGTKNTSKDGRRCLNWVLAAELDPGNAVYAHLEGFGDHSYCRADAYVDVDDVEGQFLDPPWCLIAVADGHQLDWDYCFRNCKGIHSLC